MTELAERFWRDGFLHIRGFFETAQVMRWREAALRRKTKQDLLSDDVLSEVILDDKILDLSRQILGPDIVYFGDSTVASGYNGWGFHKDNSDRLDAKAPDWQVDRYPLIRYGIYGQDHDPEPGGLELRLGSHLIPDFKSGKYTTPTIRVGDLIVWNQRTTHSAGVRKIKGLGFRLPHNRIVLELNTRGYLEWMMQRPKSKRVGLFATFAHKHPLLDRHIEYLKQREYPWKMWADTEWSEGAKQSAADKGIDLIDVKSFVYDGRARYEGYHQLAY